MEILSFELHPDSLLIGMLIIFILLAVEWRRRRSRSYVLCLFLFTTYLLVILDVMFLPIQVPQGWPRNLSMQQELFILSHINIIPFYFGDLFRASKTTIFWELAGNILLTVPLGFGLPFLILLSAKRVVWIGCITGLVLEAAQFAISVLGLVSGHYGHSIDVNDMILNAGGVLLGYALFRWVIKLPLVQKFQRNSVFFLKSIV